MKTRIRTHTYLDTIVEDIQKSEVQDDFDNLIHHQKFFPRKEYISDFKKYLWKEIYATKNLYTMGKITWVFMYCLMVIVFMFEKKIIDSKPMETIFALIGLLLVGWYIFSFPLVRRYYKKQLRNPNHNYIFKTLRWKAHHYEKWINKNEWFDYIISKYSKKY